MTIEAKIREHLTGDGLWPGEVDTVLENLKKDAVCHMDIRRYSEEMSIYPPTLTDVLILRAEDIALEWLKEVRPKHFAIDELERKL